MRGLIFAFAAFACSDYDLKETNPTNLGDVPIIEVDPLSLNFGTLSGDDDPAALAITVTNVGTSDLDVSLLEIVGESAASFTIWNNPGSMLLPPGGNQEVTLVFEPSGANELVAQVHVHSNDEDNPIVPVDLVGAGAVPLLQIIPDPLDMGATYVGCNKTNELLLSNVGSDTLELYALEHTGTPFAITSMPTMPLSLEPGEFTSVGLSFTPSDNTDALGILTAVSNEPTGIRTAMQTARGDYIATYEQTWENPVDPPSDIIFSVDLSCSMDDDVSRLANNFNTFIDELSNYSNDWQIMVVNEDSGCTNSGILYPAMGYATYSSIFSQAVQCTGSYYCYEGAYTESLLTIASNAVENTDPGECNAGFMRSNAMLHVVMVSDEPEQSWNSWSSYVNQIIAKKGNADSVRLSSIAGDYPYGCSTADAGTGYWEATNATGGVFLSICSDWSDPANLQLLAEASVLINSYPLDNDVLEETLRVYIDSAEATGTWHYDLSINSVVFDTSPPAEGQTVRITYSSPAYCD
jgi:hypothetical protein